MNLFHRGSLVLGLLGVAGAAQAGISSTWTLTNDYDFRGQSQSSKDPALQASLDYAHDSGFYAGAWASNVDFGDDVIDYELDVYAGFTRTIESSGITWDAGLVTYNYPDESDANYFEGYASIAKDWWKAKLWYSPDYGGDFTSGNTEAYYIEANGTWALPQNFSLLAHIGYADGDYWDASDAQTDFSIGVGYSINNFDLAVKYVDTDGDEIRQDAFNNEGRVILTVATTFPWSKE